MSIAKLFLCFAVFIATSCSSVEKREAVKADHDMDMKIPAIDDMIVTHKREYIERCYMPVLKRIPSNSPRPCETALQQALDRRYSMNFTQEQVDITADELFFKDMRERLSKKMRAEPNLRRAVSKRFSNMDGVMAYYQPRYTFKKTSN
ncbi:MAG: hypothetical protein LBH25_12785 [Fibromonadaceae bacterium]|jgi:hypothetical protein|nr:hypothetical protein [Fibromonadaceae bacterium]